MTWATTIVAHPGRGAHRIPAPPAALRGRATIAAFAAGALAAAGHTLGAASSSAPQPDITRLAAGALISSTPEPVGSPPEAFGLGGDQPPGAAPVEDALDAVDVQSLTKALDMGQALARQGRGGALTGAPRVAIFDGATFVRPCAGQLTSGYGARWGTQHLGIDLANRIGTPIYAVTDGVVVESGPISGYGMWVRVGHPGGWTSVYGHINRSLVKVGQKVKAGQQIAEMGNRGNSTGPHLHLEIWDDAGRRINPIPWLAQRGIRV